jgi:hypothetical protein
LTRLAQADRAGNLRPVPAPRWEPTGEGTMRVDGNAVEVRTNNKPFAYQAVARMPVGRETAWLVRFAMDVVEGGATIGALDDAGRWIETRSRSEPGILEGELRLVGFNGKSPTLVLANNNPAGASRFALTRINIQTDSNEKER